MVPANTAMESRVGDDDDGIAEASSDQQRKLLKTFTVVGNSQVTVTVERSVSDKAVVAPPRTLPVVDAQLQKYAQKMRARLRDGTAARARGNIKAPRLPHSVAALVTARAVADMFANGAASDFCAVCERGLEHATMSLQLVGFTEASVTLAPMCNSCVVGAKKAKPAPMSKTRVLKRYDLWKELTRVTFEGNKHKVSSLQVQYYRRMVAATANSEARGDEWENASEHEKRLFLKDLAPALEKRNNTKFYRAMVAEKQARARVEARLQVMREAVEHAVPDYLV
jgi:hypothetical protein